MRRPTILALMGMLFLSAPIVRAGDQEGGDLRKILREVEELRKLAEKAVNQPNETKTLQTALEESRQELAKTQMQAMEFKLKLTAAETELQLYKKNQALLEARLADLESRQQPKEESLPAPTPTIAPMPKLLPEVRGKISSVADSGLYVISIGADEGLTVGQSVEVYRAGDPTKSLGALSLVRAYNKQSIGQFRPTGNERPEVGDEVSCRIAPK